MGGGVIMGSFFKGSTLYREDENGDYLKVNDLIPLHHWKMQEESGTDVNDGGNNPETLQNVNVTINQTGKIDKCYDFDGSGQRLRSTYVPTGTTGSFSFWANIDAFDNCAIISSSDESSTNYYWSIRFVSGNIIQILTREGGSSYTTEGTTSLSTGVWYHFAVVSLGDSYKVYINGTEETLTGDNDGKWFGDISNRDNFVLGAFQRTSVSGGYNGRIEDVRLYDYPLSEQEIATIYNAGNGTLSNSLVKVYPTIKDPVHHWKFQEQSGTDVNDSMGGLVLSNTNATVNQAGKIGKAYSFNGSSSYCQAALPTDMKTATGSFAVWANFGDTAGNTEAILTASKSGQNTRMAIRRSGTNESIQALCQENGTYNWILGFDYQITNAGWLHIVLTQDGVEPKFYVNGQEQVTVFQNSDDKTKWLTFANFDLFNIGVTKAMSDYGYFGGLIEDVRYYDYALGQQEIDNIYNLGRGLLL
jgi:hypothetical protein